MNEKTFTWAGRIQDHPAHDLIAAYLTVDIQHSAEWAQELAQKTAAVQSGELSHWERNGNAYHLNILPTHVEIETDFDDQPADIDAIPLEDFAAAVTAWQTFIKS